MKLSGEWFRDLELTEFEEVEKKLGGMRQKNRSFLILSRQSGDYIQVGGIRDRFTIELRLYQPEGGFLHWKADHGEEEKPEQAFVVVAGQEVRVSAAQVFTQGETLSVLKTFYETGKADKAVSWKDMTEMFL